MSMYKKPCTEILKLKEMLEKAEIPYVFMAHYPFDKNEEFAQKYPDISEHYQICYPEFEPKNRKISVIEGFGTYGREDDLLEIMGLLTPEELEHDTVVGWLTAEEVFERINKDWSENNESCK